MYKIGAVSEILNISVQTIRYYEKYGLISPDYICPNSGYRYYDDKSLGELWRITVLKSAGFTLKDIKNMNNSTLDYTKTQLMDKKESLIKNIKLQELALSYLQRNIDRISEIEDGIDTTGIYKTFDDRKGIGIQVTDQRNLEEHFRNLNKVHVLHGMHQEVLYQPSRQTSISSSGEYSLIRLLALYQDYKCESHEESVQKGGLYFCKKTRGSGSFRSTYSDMITKIESDGYSVRGDAIELLLIDDTLASDPHDYLYEVQIALKEA